LNTEE
jgi:ankyrin repeat protein